MYLHGVRICKQLSLNKNLNNIKLAIGVKIFCETNSGAEVPPLFHPSANYK